MPKVASQKVSARSTQIDKPFICSVCKKGSKTAKYLKRHMEIHDPSTKNKYPCSEPGCSHSARQKGNLDEHKKAVHLCIKDLRCPHCDFVTSRSANIIHHQRQKHPELPFVRLADIRALSTLSPFSPATSPSSSSSTRDSSPTDASTSMISPVQPPVYDNWMQDMSMPDINFDFDFDVLNYMLPTDVYLPPNPLAFELFPATSSKLADQDHGYSAFLQGETQEDQSPATLASPASSCGLRLPMAPGSWEQQTVSNQFGYGSEFACGYQLEGFSSQIDEWLSASGAY